MISEPRSSVRDLDHNSYMQEKRDLRERNQKRVQTSLIFCGQNAPAKISSGGLSAVARDSSKNPAYVKQEHQDWEAF